MKKLLSGFLFVAALNSMCALQAQQAPTIEWEKSLGGTYDDEATSIQQTTDGGFIVAGYSFSNDGDVSGNHGGDYWIVKLNTGGNIIWQKCFGGTGDEIPFSVQETNDDGFIIAGHTSSYDADVSGNHGSLDYWILKLDAAGNLKWQKSLGGSSNDVAYSIQQTTEGGFIVAGSSYSTDGDVSGHHGASDYWIVKLDTIGNLIWQKSLGGSDEEIASSIQQTTDGGFIIAGSSYSNDGDVSGSHGTSDCWIVKLSSAGNFSWQKSLGGSNYDKANFIEQTSDGGFIIAGISASNDGDVSGNHDGYYGASVDCWIAKLNTTGDIVWQKSLGGSSYDAGRSIKETIDGGFIISGSSGSNDGDVSGWHNGYSGGNYEPYSDYWTVKLDTYGNLLWQKCLGGSIYDDALSVQQTTDGGYVIAGYTSSPDGDVSENRGGRDYWIVKLMNDTLTGVSLVTKDMITVNPNPVQAQLTINVGLSLNDFIIRIYDLQGKIRQTALSGQSDKILVNTENLSDGFYTIRVINNKTGEYLTGKFVKRN